MKRAPAAPGPAPLRFVLEDDGPSYLGIKRALLARIGSQWAVGDRLPPIRDLARDMSVSPNNVQRAVRELVEEGVLFSRKRLGLFVRALPQQATAGQTRRQPRSPLQGQTIQLMVFDEPVPGLVQRMTAGFTQAIADSGARTQVVPLALNQPLPAKQDCWGMVLFNPDGVVSLPSGYRNVTVVSTADHLHADLISQCDRIGVDQYQGGMLAGQMLRRAGAKRCCFLGRQVVPGSKRYDLTSSSRLHGFEHTWGRHLDASDLLYAPGYSVESGALRFVDYLARSPRPDAVFAASDELAVGFMAAATGAGLRVGRDYLMVGFDGQDTRNDDASELATVRVPAVRMGQVAAQLLLQRVADPARPVQHVALPCSAFLGSLAGHITA